MALTSDPLRFLTSSWPWRSTAYLLTSWIVAMVWVSATALLLIVPAFGLALLLGGIPLAAFERRRLRLIDPAQPESPHVRPPRPGFWAWLSTRFREATTWRELGYAVLFSLVLAWVDAIVGLLVACALYLIAFPVLVSVIPEYQPELFGLIPARRPEALLATVAGLAFLPVTLYLVTAFASCRARLTRHFLVSRRADADRRVRELSRSRERILDAMDAQRRRIERDLHDGAQQRLTGVIMTLGRARLQLAAAPGPARETVEDAYQQARSTLSELRELVHGIHPQVLTNRGLSPAVIEVAERLGIPVGVRIDLPHRPPETVEAAAWFVISEGLTNIARHSKADRAWISCTYVDGMVIVEVGDDGLGAADPDHGTGLHGLGDRVSVLRGRITLDSPVGGPTVLRAELPCD
ncbi:sensor histidine kinase [Cryptosporangium sp. NPDC048952]|uniref:sensor histidine kinase n=1 Tax=Cryptosporangium sp. NPDC048952 TaxID=3363961 RepID=UPI0037122CCA